MISNACGVFFTRRRRPMDGRGLPDDDTVAYDEFSNFEVRPQMLRRQPHIRRRTNLTIPANDRPSLQMRMFMDHSPRPDPHRTLDDAVAADDDPIAEFRFGVHQGRGMYVVHNIGSLNAG
jgi:hypothetical protein